MTTNSSVPVRLVYSALPYGSPDEGRVFDAARLERLAGAASATTVGEFVERYYDTTLEAYLEEYEGLAGHSGDDPAQLFSLGAWFTESYELSAEELAEETAGATVARILSDDDDGLAGLSVGGGSPAGHPDVISGPLAALEVLAERVSGVEGFSLERDDDLVHAAYGRL